MRRLEFLIEEVIDSSDARNNKPYTNYELMRHFNSAQRTLQKMANSAVRSGELYIQSQQYDSIVDTGMPLPSDIHMQEGIVSVISNNSSGRRGRPYNRITPAEMGFKVGYFTLNGKLFISSVNKSNGFTLIYKKALPLMSLRIGEISSIDISSSKVNFDPTTVPDPNHGYTSRYDYCSIVDFDGNIKSSNLRIKSQSGNSLTLIGDMTESTTGDYVVAGRVATTHSELPNACEEYLLSYVERRLKNKIASDRSEMESLFTQKERRDIKELFEDMDMSVRQPVIMDYDYRDL